MSVIYTVISIVITIRDGGCLVKPFGLDDQMSEHTFCLVRPPIH